LQALRRGLRTALLAAGLLMAMLPGRALAQADLPDLLKRVFPQAQRFSAKEGTPPVFKAYGPDPATGRETLLGYAFLTSDLPPEEMGYNAPIQVLVGMDLVGTLTGIAVVDYRESLRSTRGDFLRGQGFQSQFGGKGVADPFRVRVDLDGISGATISVAAMARGIRNSARRVATAYLTGSRIAVPEPLHPGTITPAKLAGLSWPDLVDGGLVQQLMLLEEDRSAIELSIVYLRDAEIGAALMGAAVYEGALERLAERTPDSHLILVGVDGPLGALYRATATYLMQGSDTVRMANRDLALLGQPRTGMVAGQFQNMGLLAVDAAVIDAQRPFTFQLDLRPGLSYASTEFPGLTPPPAPRPAAVVVAEAAPAPDAPAAVDGAAASDSAADTDADAAERAALADVEEQLAEALAQAQAPLFEFDFADDADESILARTLAGTSWWRVTWMVLLLGLASAAFVAKRPGLRWAALAATTLYLGILRGGFLSVSHITAGIKVGPSVYLSDLPLLLLVAFTVVTTLLWGRVFCGTLCPFGALQDFLSKVVPRRFRREVPRVLHERGLYVKYGVLAVVLIPAIAGSDVSIFQYFEPFGTVFFFSTSAVLWLIAGSILLATAVVPRFYCRYMCPLGAALAIGSLAAPLRIGRVEQCTLCKVCETGCPTGAIRKERIDFKECVRCNVCETKLIEKAGVCKHDMEAVRPRLIQLKVAQR